MFKNHLKVVFRNLYRHKTHAFINIFGLALGLASAILIMLFVRYEQSFDRFHENASRIQRVAVRAMIGNTKISQTFTPAILTPTLLEHYPQVESSVRFQDAFEGVIVKAGDLVFNEYRVGSTDAEFFSMFTFPLLAGDPETALAEPQTVVITESMARKYFLGREALNQTINISGDDFRVSGVMADFPDNSHFKFDMLRSLKSYPDRLQDPNWFNNSFRTYILMRDQVSPASLESKFPEIVRNYATAGQDYDTWAARGNYWEYYLQPLTSIHLDSDLNGEFEANGNGAYVNASFMIALFILLIASVNYMNLATARSAGRAKEVGIRKVVGSTRSALVRQFLLESLGTCFLALVLAVSLVQILLPAFSSLTKRALELPLLKDPASIPALLCLALLLGLVSGIYPAFYLAREQPIKVLRDSAQRGSRKFYLRNTLVFVQFSISIFLVVGTIVVNRQTDFMRRMDLGFDKEHVVVLRTPVSLGPRSRTFKDQLLSLPGILAVSGSDTTPGRSFRNWGCMAEGLDESLTLNMSTVDEGYLETMGLDMVSGRFFSKEFATDTRAIVLNETALKIIGWDDPIGKTIAFDTEQVFTVIGIVQDFHYESLHQSVRPGALIAQPGIWETQEDYISARLRPGDIIRTLADIRKIWDGFSIGYPLEYSFLDADYDALYDSEVLTGRIFSVFAALAIGIGCLGLLGLALFAAEQKTREIGIRRVLGASVPGIMALLSRDLLRWVALANLVAWPLSYLAMQRWLQTFSFRIGLHWVFFAVAGLLTLLIAWFSTSFQAYKAATADPVKALKHE